MEDPFNGLREAERREWATRECNLILQLANARKESQGLRLALQICQRRRIVRRWANALFVFLVGMVAGMIAGRV